MRKLALGLALVAALTGLAAGAAASLAVSAGSLGAASVLAQEGAAQFGQVTSIDLHAARTIAAGDEV